MPALFASATIFEDRFEESSFIWASFQAALGPEFVTSSLDGGSQTRMGRSAVGTHDIPPHTINLNALFYADGLLPPPKSLSLLSLFLSYEGHLPL